MEIVTSHHAASFIPLFVAHAGRNRGTPHLRTRYQVLFNDLEAMHVDEFGIPFFHDSKIWRVGAKTIGHCAKAPLE